MLKGEKECFDKLKSINQNDKIAWFHCASLGEFEQGRPLLEEIKKLPADIPAMLEHLETEEEYDRAAAAVRKFEAMM